MSLGNPNRIVDKFPPVWTLEKSEDEELRIIDGDGNRILGAKWDGPAHESSLLHEQRLMELIDFVNYYSVFRNHVPRVNYKNQLELVEK